VVDARLASGPGVGERAGFDGEAVGGGGDHVGADGVEVDVGEGGEEVAAAEGAGGEALLLEMTAASV
jgi:hypothetical protein